MRWMFMTDKRIVFLLVWPSIDPDRYGIAYKQPHDLITSVVKLGERWVFSSYLARQKVLQRAMIYNPTAKPFVWPCFCTSCVETLLPSSLCSPFWLTSPCLIHQHLEIWFQIMSESGLNKRNNSHKLTHKQKKRWALQWVTKEVVLQDSNTPE